jgi:hypothetical protein
VIAYDQREREALTVPVHSTWLPQFYVHLHSTCPLQSFGHFSNFLVL